MKIFHDAEILSMFSILTILLVVSLSDTFQQRDMRKQIEKLEKNIQQLTQSLEPALPEWEEK